MYSVYYETFYRNVICGLDKRKYTTTARKRFAELKTKKESGIDKPRAVHQWFRQ